MTVTARPDGAPRTTRLGRDNAARHTLRTAREAQRILRNAGDGAELDRKLDELVLDYGDLTGGRRLWRPPVAGVQEKRQLINGIARAAVFLRAHTWAECDVRHILYGAPADGAGDHLGERQAAETLDALGYLTLPGADGAGWGFTLLKEATADDEQWRNIVKGARYLLDPSFLMLFGDTAKILGEATYAWNISAFKACVQGVEGLVVSQEPTLPPEPSTDLPTDRRLVPDVLPDDAPVARMYREGSCLMSAEELLNGRGPWPRGGIGDVGGDDLGLPGVDGI
ncbi:hypothetical protein ACH4UM_19220 [Streptomyces sp. NPDC020801]|uniref:hypothetical protein n=1 Tax=Streptomyces sp. NPDC020801 TaxID=3365093 RepID=UPI0037ACC54E